jgi:hypothetical protein
MPAFSRDVAKTLRQARGTELQPNQIGRETDCRRRIETYRRRPGIAAFEKERIRRINKVKTH